MKKTINIEGMNCGHCVSHVKEALGELKDTKVIEVSLENKHAVVDTDISDNEIVSSIDEAGYEVTSIK